MKRKSLADYLKEDVSLTEKVSLEEFNQTATLQDEHLEETYRQYQNIIQIKQSEENINEEKLVTK